ncbi:potassium channel family protein [Candidatus Omnitrophota bacterium]
MEKEKVFAVFGLGTFGLEICKVLSSKGAKVIAVDRNQKSIEKIKDVVTQAVAIDSTDEEDLLNAGLQDVDVAVISIGDNIDASILTTTLLKNIGVPYIIARAMSGIHAQVLKQIGATEVMNLEIEQGQRLANRIFAPEIMDVIHLSDDQSLAELRVPKDFIGKSLQDLDLRKKFNVNVISVKRTKTDIDKIGNPERKELVFSPKPMDILEINDILVVLGNEQDMNRLKETVK